MRIIESGFKSAKELMKMDEIFLEELHPDDLPLLHLYRFKEKSITFGHFLHPEEYIDLEKAKKWGLDLSKRPTGGGMTFHIWDLAFSILIPSNHPGYYQDTLKNYAFVNERVLQTVKAFLGNSHPIDLLPEEAPPLDDHAKAFCMAKPTKYDVMIGGKKIAGAAQRRKKQGYLHQGSISLAMPKFEELESLLHPGTKVIDAMKLHTASLIGSVEDIKLYHQAQSLLEHYLVQSFECV